MCTYQAALYVLISEHYLPLIDSDPFLSGCIYCTDNVLHTIITSCIIVLRIRDVSRLRCVQHQIRYCTDNEGAGVMRVD